MKQTDSTTKNGSAPQLSETVLFCLYYTLACAYIPLCAFLNIGAMAVSVISLAVCVLGVAVMARAAGSFKAVLGYALILGIFIFFGGSLTPAGMFSAFATAVCIYAHLHLKRPSPFLWGLPAIPLIITLLITGSATASVISVISLPAAIALMLAVKETAGKVGAICRISFGICLSAVAVFACAVYSAYGSISFALCKQAIDTAREVITELVLLGAREMEVLLGSSLSMLGEDEVAYAVGVVFNVLPAVTVIIANVAAYVIHSMFLSIRFVTVEEKKQALPMLSFEMSLASAIVFLLALLLSFVLVSDSAAMYGAVAENIMLILVPGLILTALAGIRALAMHKGPSCLGTVVYLGAIFLIASLSPPVIIIAATVGAVLIIATHAARHKAGKSNE